MAVAATSTISERENMMMGWEKERRKIEAIWRDPYIEWCHARRGPKSENGKTRAKKGQSDARALAGYLCATQNSLIWHVRLSFCDIWQRLFDRNVAMNGAKPRVLQFSCRLRRNRHYWFRPMSAHLQWATSGVAENNARLVLLLLSALYYHCVALLFP